MTPQEHQVFCGSREIKSPREARVRFLRDFCEDRRATGQRGKDACGITHSERMEQGLQAKRGDLGLCLQIWKKSILSMTDP